MKAIRLHSKPTIEKFLLSQKETSYYLLGDLDEFFWPNTEWYGLGQETNLKTIALIYSGGEQPVLLNFSKDIPTARSLLRDVITNLPEKFEAHLSPELEQEMLKDFSLVSRGEHFQMVLKDASKVYKIDTGSIKQYTLEETEELSSFYDTCYPGNWFDPRLLKTGQYFCAKNEDGKILSIAGVHVYSPEYKVAALGNITTHPEFRRQGLATLTTAALCKNLLKNIDCIGLSVKADNIPAVKTYQTLGFQVVGSYYEYMVERNGNNQHINPKNA
ncbi:MAG: GNAT family N-acetyltransferase [Anaerolineales bacterium]|nr:GNAT family N-acetyltransferase [Anaerolineales bacterium]